MIWHKSSLSMCSSASSITSKLTLLTLKISWFDFFSFLILWTYRSFFAESLSLNFVSPSQYFLSKFFHSALNCFNQFFTCLFPPFNPTFILGSFGTRTYSNGDSCLSFLSQPCIHSQLSRLASLILLSAQLIISQPWITTTSYFPCLLN